VKVDGEGVVFVPAFSSERSEKKRTLEPWGG
jgi:hypothetical protein